MNHILAPAVCAAISLACCAMAFKNRYEEHWAVFYSFTAFIISGLGLYALFHG